LWAPDVIPLDNIAASGTAPSLFLFIQPGAKAYFLLPANIGQHFAVVRSAIIVKINDSLTGEISALGATGYPLFLGTGAHDTFTTHDSHLC
jgi:hypothetical protein